MTELTPRTEEIQRAAFELFERRGRSDGWAIADWLLAERALVFDRHYERIARYRFNEKVQIGAASGRECRFCKRGHPDVSFDKAHAIPEFLGNDKIFLRDECDSCNNFFGRGIEDHFAKMLSGPRSLMGIRGKQGVPSYKTRDKQSRIDANNGGLEITQGSGGAIASIDDTKRVVNFDVQSQPHVPLAVYKCLAKIALSILPVEELPQFDSTRRWICESDHSRGAESLSNSFVDVWSIGGRFPDRYGWTEVFRRRHDSLPVPYVVLILATSNLTFHTYVPFCAKDEHLINRHCTFPPFPGGLEVIGKVGYEWGEPRLEERIPLGSVSITTIPFQTQFTMVGEWTRNA